MLVIHYIYGLIVVAILLAIVMNKYWNNRVRGEWILAGFLIAIISLPVGLFISPVLQIITRLFLPEGGFNQLFSILSMFIILSLCYTHLRKGSTILFAKVFVVSFIVLLLLTITWFSLSMSGGMFIVIEESIIPAGEKIKFAEITQEELENCPPLKQAMNAYKESNNNNFKVDTEDEMIVGEFIIKKRNAARYLFSISGGNPEEFLNKGVFSQELNSIFKSNNFSISENATINHVNENRWHIFEKDELTYVILKEEGKLKVYDEKYSGDTFFKIGENYYKISIYQED